MGRGPDQKRRTVLIADKDTERVQKILAVHGGSMCAMNRTFKAKGVGEKTVEAAAEGGTLMSHTLERVLAAVDAIEKELGLQ